MRFARALFYFYVYLSLCMDIDERKGCVYCMCVVCCMLYVVCCMLLYVCTATAAGHAGVKFIRQIPSRCSNTSLCRSSWSCLTFIVVDGLDIIVGTRTQPEGRAVVVGGGPGLLGNGG